jgi:hypothetical protein
MAKNYYINEHPYLGQVVHGHIGNIDTEKILADNGYQAIQFPYIFSYSLKAKLARFFYLVKTFFTIPVGARVVFQFPLHAHMHRLLINLLRWKNIQIVATITDIEGLRNLDDRLLQREKRALQKLKFIIVHNASMAAWMRQVAPHAHLTELEFFDFLAQPMPANRSKTGEVVFAGNLEKSPFVRDLVLLPVSFRIYGSGRQPAAPNIIYEGVFGADTILGKLKGSFGLIWDGISIDRCAGEYGAYLAYNSPHKLSLYILAGLPIIAPATAASGQLVKKYGIGITINNLHEIKTAIDSVSEEAYRQMIRNMQPLAQRISSGQCLLHALSGMAPGSNTK